MITDEAIVAINAPHIDDHQRRLESLRQELRTRNLDIDQLIRTIEGFEIAVPSWALGTGGTRFGRFPGGGEPASLHQKIADIGLLHRLNASCGSVSLHIPWDIPGDAEATRKLAASHNIGFDAVNSNTFQDQPDAPHSYKFGSLCHVDSAVRKQAVNHNKEVIDYGVALGSKALTVWLADGSNFTGQHNFREAFKRTLGALQEIYAHLPGDWKLLVEYKPYEPNFYSMVIPDWGTSHLLATELGEQATTLVDLGHHLPNTNIEQIVSVLMMKNKLGGFHFNDSKYGDDDLTVGAMKPYQLFLIFNELVDGFNHTENQDVSWMIDASHNTKDPLEDLLQSIEAIKIAYAQALIVDRPALAQAQKNNDVSLAQEVLQDAFRTDVRPLVAEARLRQRAVLRPLETYRQLDVRNTLVDQRGKHSMATGL
ncbi:MAG: TIM barrel protein [Bacteroidota bacterium]